MLTVSSKNLIYPRVSCAPECNHSWTGGRGQRPRRQSWLGVPRVTPCALHLWRLLGPTPATTGPTPPRPRLTRPAPREERVTRPGPLCRYHPYDQRLASLAFQALSPRSPSRSASPSASFPSLPLPIASSIVFFSRLSRASDLHLTHRFFNSLSRAVSS